MDKISEEQRVLKYILDDFENKTPLISFKMGVEMIEWILRRYLHIIDVGNRKTVPELKDLIGNDVLLISKLIKNLTSLENDNNTI